MSVLVDSSVWSDHFQTANADLKDLLEQGQVVCHPFVIGELACGSLRNRAETLRLLGFLPRVTEAAHAEVIHLVEEEQLYSRGLGWIDVHLLASCRLSQARLWTIDQRLASAANRLGVGYGV